MALRSLNIIDCPFAWVNIGNNKNLTLYKSDSTISIDASEDTFQITDKFEGIDKSKVDIKSGAVYDKNTGIVSEYHKDVPIIFNYDCGTSNNGPETLQVTVRLTDIAINEKNFPDEVFRKWLTEQSYGTDGIIKEKEMIQIDEINVSNNVDIKSLQGIEYFTALETLNCYNTGITTLDVSKNKNLQVLGCQVTKITGLDVSNNQALKELFCGNCPLAWLNIYENADFKALIISNSTVSLDMIEDTFDIAKEFPGIDTSKISDVKGAYYKDGIFSNYHKNTPIIYTYNYGTASTGKKTFQVTLNLIGYKEKSTISITEDLNKYYDRTAVNSSPNVEVTGSAGDVSYTWEKKTGDDNWITIASAPTDAGSYRVTATVATDDDYREATSEPKEFKISQATNAWDSELTIKGWTYKETNNKPSASAKFGTVTYSYSDSETGPFTIDVPTTAGTWYVKATVTETNNYKGLEAVKSFTIEKAESTISIKENPGKTYDGTAVKAKPDVNILGSQGDVTYEWYKKMDNNKWEKIDYIPTEVGTYRVIATLATDENYNGARSEPKEFKISQAENEWNSELTIKGWTYKETNNNPSASAKFGTVTYSYSDSETGLFRKDVPTTAGTWYVKATVAGTENYTELKATKSFTIEKADSTISIKENPGKTYDGTAVKAKLDVDTSGSKGNVTYDWYKNTGNNNWSEIEYAPTEAGTYRVIAKLAADNNYKEAYSLPEEFKIRQATNDWKENLTMEGWVYQDTANKPSASAKFGTPVFTYSDSETGEFIDKVPTTVGTWYVKATVEGTDNYTGIEEIKSFTITQATNEWKEQLSIKDWKYQDTANKPSASAKFGTVTYSYSDSETGPFTIDVPTTAGKWYVKATIAETNNYKGLEAVKSFTIEKAESTISIKENLGKIYDGTAVNEKPNVDTSGSQGNVTYKWEKKTGKDTWASIESAPTNAGTYRVMATLLADKNYNSASSEPKEFTIALAQNEWQEELSIEDWTYLEEPKNPRAKAKHGTPVFTYSDSINGEFRKDVPTTAGTWYVKATVITENYEKLEAIKDFKIEKADSTISIKENPGKTYDGMAVKATLDVSTSGSKGNVTYEWYKNTGNDNWSVIDYVPTEVGRYRVIAKLAADNNYKEAHSAPVEFTITQATNGWIENLSMEGWVYQDTVNKPIASAKFGTPVFTYSDSETGDFTDEVPTTVGTWYVKATVKGTDNYTGIEEIASFTITKATNEWKEQLSIKDWKYQDMANKPSASAKFGTPVFTYSDAETGKFTADVPTTVGTWYVKAVVAGNENYTGIEAVQSFKIEKADSIIHVIDSLDKTYDERAVNGTPEVTIKGSTGRVSYKWEKRMGNNWIVMDSAPMNAGTYRVTAVLAGDDNFNETSSEPKVFRIAQAPNAWVEDLSIMGWTYQGAMKQPSASAKYGTPVFTYSDSKDGIFTSKVPTTAGTWYVKATVITENYEKLEVVQSFTIEPKHIEEDSEILVPEITPEMKLDDLSFQDGDKVLVQGTDYIVTKKQNGNKVTVTITFKGNYRGEITKTYTVNEDKGSANTDHSVDTGDTTRTGLWATFLALSGGLIVFLTGKKRKSPIEKK